MDAFIQKSEKDVTGVLSGWDRLMIRGTLRALAVTRGMMNYLYFVGVLLKDFGTYVERTSEHLRETCVEAATKLGRPVQYLPSSRTCKEDIAAGIAQADGITEGLIGLLSCVEPCMSYVIRRDREQKKLVLQPALRKCLHLYHYWMDRDFGQMHARIQTWFPFSIQVCLNGRSWLARQMDRCGMTYVQSDNCFLKLGDAAGAQRLSDGLLRWDWPSYLNGLAQEVNPVLPEILRGYRVGYYWSAYESEWATDVMFRSPSALGAIYPALARGAITAFDSSSVLRFLGRKPSGRLLAEVTSDYRRRPEGLRVKHAVGSNSVKMYDKEGRVLRVETTINDPRDMKVYRSGEGDSGGRRSWRRMRKGVVDLRRRAEVSQGCNERYYDALAKLDTSTPLCELIAPICRPTTLGRCRVRAMRPWSGEDLALLRAINRGEHALTGFRNRDLLQALHGDLPAPQKRRVSSQVGHRLRLLRAHHLIKKIAHTHRYQLTPAGRQIITAILQTQDVSLATLAKLAA
jgi:hypothetical protein